MRWYKWKWWRIAKGFVGNDKPGHTVAEMGYAWVYLCLGFYFCYRTWKVVRIEVTDKELGEIAPGLMDWYINQKFVQAGADITRGKFTKYYDTIGQKYNLWWEDTK